MCMATATSSHVARHEVVAEAHRRGEADGVQHAVDAAPLLGRAPSRTASTVLGDGDVELEHVDVVAELAGGALR